MHQGLLGDWHGLKRVEELSVPHDRRVHDDLVDQVVGRVDVQRSHRHRLASGLGGLLRGVRLEFLLVLCHMMSEFGVLLQILEQ